jgi:hypothetical protein
VTTFIKGHFRGAQYRPAYIAKTTELLPYDLGAMLERELDKALDEPLDAPQFNDLSREDKQRLREV